MAQTKHCQSIEAQSFFEKVQPAPAIEVFELTRLYNEDKDPRKVNLSVGAYRDDEGRPWVLPVVRTAEAQMAADQSLNHEYLPVAGLAAFRSACIKLLLGDESKARQTRADSIQGLGGTGAIRVGLEFLKRVIGLETVYVSNPTWGNHKGVAKAVGFTDVRDYRYWNEGPKTFDMEGMVADLENAPAGSIVLLHVCCHNPTGIDPTIEEWHRLADVIKEKKLFPFFDGAYQGFATGDLEVDAFPVRYFADSGFELFAAQSFSKNFGLYNERVGNLVFVTNHESKITPMKSQMEIIVRQMYSNPSNHGGRVVATVLNNPTLNNEWREHVRSMADRIKQMRNLLVQKLRALGTPGTWDHIIQQRGMFSYTGLKKPQCERLIREYHVYVMRDGRINMCGLTQKNMDYVAQCIFDVVTGDEPKL